MHELPSAPVFQPSYEEFKDFSKYLKSIEPEWKSSGICKIIPPKEWKEKIPFNLDKVDKLIIPSPITQYVTGNKGVYQLMLVENKEMSVKEYREKAEKEKIPRSAKYKDEEEEIDRIFWKNVRFNPAIYGADMPGSLQPSNLTVWNMNHLDSLLKLMNKKMPGITEPYLYFGMWKAMFAWHVEDMNLFSINYLHYGAPKTWYAIPPDHSARFERLCQTYFPDQYRSCPEFLRHKTSLISPSILQKNNIPITTMVHKEGEIALTYSYAYHCGFNHGFNCAESVNFALESWIPYGLQARTCHCQSDTASLDVQQFVKCYENYKKTGQFSDPTVDNSYYNNDYSNNQQFVSPSFTSTVPSFSVPSFDPFTSTTEENQIYVTDMTLNSNHSLGSPLLKEKKIKKPKKLSNPLPNNAPEEMIHDSLFPRPEPISPKKSSKRSALSREEGLLDLSSSSISILNSTQPEHSPRKKMKRMTESELMFLTRLMEDNNFVIPNLQAREEIANKIGWTAQGVYNWCRRYLMKKKMINEPSQNTFPPFQLSSSPSLFSETPVIINEPIVNSDDHDSIDLVSNFLNFDALSQTSSSSSQSSNFNSTSANSSSPNDSPPSLPRKKTLSKGPRRLNSSFSPSASSSPNLSENNDLFLQNQNIPIKVPIPISKDIFSENIDKDKPKESPKPNDVKKKRVNREPYLLRRGTITTV